MTVRLYEYSREVHVAWRVFAYKGGRGEGDFELSEALNSPAVYIIGGRLRVSYSRVLVPWAPRVYVCAVLCCASCKRLPSCS